MLDNKQLNERLSDDELRRIVGKQLPAWERACAASGATAIVLHESAFGRSRAELLLLGCAIKYAALSGKAIHIASGERRDESAPASIHRSPAVRTFRERLPRATNKKPPRKPRNPKDPPS
jgi:hypothetical protein